jgi:thioredoxin-like negative regulator of GroEL
MTRRILTNLALLAACGATFYLFTVVSTWLVSNESLASREFSENRIRADQFVRSRDWERATEYLKILVDADPYDGNNLFMLATCYASIRQNHVIAIYNEQRGSAPNEERLIELREKAAEIANLAIPAYEKSWAFARFRNEARFALARIYAFQGDKEKALQYLKSAYDDKFTSNIRGGIQNVFDFQSLADDPEFIELVKQDRRNSGRRF